MLSALTDRFAAPTKAPVLPNTLRATWAARMGAPHALWLGPGGLWDHGPLPGWRPLAPRPQAAQAPLHFLDFDAWCASHPGRACGLVLSAWLVHELLLDPPEPLPNDTARLHHARALLVHYHGEAAIHWPLAAWQAAGRHGVSALHATTLGALQTSARQTGVALRSVRPWWSLALALAMQQQPRLVQADHAHLLVVDGALVTQIDLERGRLTGLQQRRLAAPNAPGLAAPLAALLGALLGALPATPDRSSSALCCVMGHGLPAASLDGLPPGVQLLGDLQGDAPGALWRTAGTAAPVRLG